MTDSEKVLSIVVFSLLAVAVIVGALWIEAYAINAVAHAIGHPEIHATPWLLFWGWLLFNVLVAALRSAFRPATAKK